MKRGIREEILDLNNRGMADTSKLRSVASAAGGLASKLKSSGSPKETKSDRDPPKLSTILFVLVVLIILPVAFFTIRAYAETEQGKTTVLKASQFFEENNPINWYFELLEGQKVLDVWESDTNSSSRQKGIDLLGMYPISLVSIPPGQPFDAAYDVEFLEVEDFDFSDVEFFCQVETITDEVEGYGTVMPKSYFGTFDQHTPVSCRVEGETTQVLDIGAYNVVGWFEFPFETSDVTLPVYFASEGVYYDLLEKEEEFFDFYNIDEKGKIRAVYNGEPLGVGIGISVTGKEEQPVYVREDTSAVLGISLENKWNGEVVNLDDMYVYLPQGIKVSEELSGGSYACPFDYVGVTEGMNMYRLNEQLKDEIFQTIYETDLLVLGETSIAGNEKNFQCWLDVESGFAGSVYTKKNYIVDVEYRYRTQKRSTEVNIVDRSPGV
ncbi:hypothetical protein CL616_04515 [archaeon]|nr:hypothetical protein [archaeon]|tara:strand:- start:1325 stop:2635 length:1311 start_codon:yes stop_codon:yes gene_type:complete